MSLAMLPDGAARDPSAIALIHAETGTTWTYERLTAAAARVAASLSSPRKQVVGWISRALPESVAGYVGALASGHAVFPLPANLADELLSRLLAAYQPDVILATPDDRLPESVTSAYDLAESGDTDMPVFWRRRATANDTLHPDLCLLLSTSGSTGSPKTVRLTRLNVLNNAAGIREALGITQAECAVTSLPLFYSFGLSVLHTHLLAGARLVLTERSVLDAQFWDAVSQHACTSLAGVPYMYAMLQRIDLAHRAPASLRTLTQAGGKMSPDLIKHFHHALAARNGRLFVMYGQTEATARITVLPPHQTLSKLGGVGFPLPGGSLHVRTRDGGPATAAAPGDIIYRGPNVMLGYAESRCDLSKGDELSGQLETGDLGYLDADGCLFVTGRSKRIAKVFGLRVSLDDIEARLATVGPLALVADDDCIAVFVPESGAALVPDALRALAGELKFHTSAFRITTVPTLPLLPNGKVDYQRLRELVAHPVGEPVAKRGERDC